MISEEELRSMYWDDDMSTYEIGKLCDVSYATVQNWMKRYGIKSRTISEAKLVNSAKPPKEYLEEMYWVNGMNISEIGKLCGVSYSTARDWIIDYGIEIRTISESRLGDSIKPSKEDLEKMYWGNGMSTYEIGKLCGVSQSTVRSWMIDYGIESRTVSEARINGDFTGKKSGGWKGGISGGKYCYRFNNKFKEAVRKRDDYTCQLCGFEQNGRRLSVHHIHYLKEDCYPDVVALCQSCNTKVNSNRDYWEKYFENQLIERGLYCWSINNGEINDKNIYSK